METYRTTPADMRRALAVACILAALVIALAVQPGCAHTQPGTPAHAAKQTAIEYGKGCVLAATKECPWDGGIGSFVECLLPQALPCTATAGAALLSLGFDLLSSVTGALSFNESEAESLEECAIAAAQGCESSGCAADRIARHCLAYVALPPGPEVD